MGIQMVYKIVNYVMLVGILSSFVEYLSVVRIREHNDLVRMASLESMIKFR